MTGMRKKCIQLCMIALVAGVFFSHARVFASPEADYISNVSTILYASVSNVNDIMTNYCSAVSSTAGFAKNGYYYDAKQSVFVQLLCQRFSDTIPDTYFKRHSFADL